MIDWDHIATLRQEIGQDDFDDIVVMFLHEVDQLFQQMQTPPGATAAALHNLKGSALNLGFRQLAQLCQTQESAMIAGHPGNVSQLYASFANSRDLFQQGPP